MPLDLDAKSIDASSYTPKYVQLADLIRAAIDDGRLQPGEQLPGEQPMAAAVGISRDSVRDAIKVLVDEGLVTRRQGAPTRVSEVLPQRRMDMTRYAEVLRSLKAGEPERLTSPFTIEHGIDWNDYTCDVKATREEATADDAQRLHLEPGEPVLRRHIVRYAGGEPSQLEESTIAWALAGDTPVADPGSQPWPGETVAELYSLGLVVTKVVVDAEPRFARDDERRQLHMETPGPLWDMVRVFWVGDRPVESSRIIAPGARNVLHYEVDLTEE